MRSQVNRNNEGRANNDANPKQVSSWFLPLHPLGEINERDLEDNESQKYWPNYPENHRQQKLVQESAEEKS